MIAKDHMCCFPKSNISFLDIALDLKLFLDLLLYFVDWCNNFKTAKTELKISEYPDNIIKTHTFHGYGFFSATQI